MDALSNISHSPAQRCSILCRLGYLLFVFLAVFGSNLRAAIRLDVFVGYDGIVDHGSFFPVVFEVFNDGPTFNALIELTPVQFNQGQVRQVPVELPTGTLKRFAVPVFSADQYRLASWNVRVFDERGKVRLETTTRQIRKNNGWSVPLMGAITRTVPPLPEVKAANQEFKPVVARLQPNLFPDNPIALEGLDVIYLSSEKALDLKLNQINALLAWLHAGGHLVVGVEQLIHINGTEWLRSLLPCELTDLTTVQDHSILQKWLASTQLRDVAVGKSTRTGRSLVVASENPYANLQTDPQFEQQPMQVALGKSRFGAEVLIGSDSLPLAYADRRGRGQITALTFAPELEPFASWNNRDHFWARMIDLPPELLAKPEYNRYVNYSIDGVFGAMIDSKQVRKLPVGWLFLLLVGYLVVIGPLDRYWLRKIGKQMLTWITFPIYVALFSGLIYFIGYKLRAGETEWNELHIIDIMPVGERADIRGHTFASVYSPVNANYRVSSDQPFATLRGELMRSGGGQETSKAVVRQRGNSFDAEISVPVWTSQLFVSEWWKQGPPPIQFSVSSKGTSWTMSVDNRSDARLGNVMVAIEDRIFTLGDVPPKSVRPFTMRKESGELLLGFVQNHAGSFNQLVSQRQAAFGYRQEQELTDVPRSTVAASFLSQLQMQPQQNNQYGYNNAITPPGFDLSPLVRRGDAVLLAWASDFAMTKPLNQFSARRSHRDSLLRVAAPVQF
jgi:hypothetical protein